MNRPEGSLISYFSTLVKRDGGINLAQGTPGFSPPAELLLSLQSHAGNSTLHQYPPGIGNFNLVELIRRNLSFLTPLVTDNLLILQGATEAISLTFLYLTTILQRPFSALSFDPVYESYPKLPAMYGIPFEYFDFEDDLSVDFEKLEWVISEKKVKIIFVSSPGNPLGKAWTREELTQLLKLSDIYGFYVLFDAVYKDLYFEEPPFNPIVFNEERLFYIDSFSKMLSITGWRIGYLIAEKSHMKRIRALHDYVGLCASSILQVAIADYLDAHEYGKNYVISVRNKCKLSYNYIKQELDGLNFNVASSHGGYFLWTQLPGNCRKRWADAFEFALALYKATGVSVVPGENFSPTKLDYLRMNIGTELEIVKEAVSKIKVFVSG